ncbi:odorant receptor 13a-like [Cardiocondyla obscurior]|uniref:odorant receptor 13a-like n=1 Tax=Cardiocondyla obscurior TaxID=286306 RepID=UPI0039658101
MKTNWNSGIDYGFSIIKSMMLLLGQWPLQNNVIHTTQWVIIFIAGSLNVLNVLIESFKSCTVERDGLEILRLIESCMHAWLNIFFSRIYKKKIAININAAIEDWSSTTMEKESRMFFLYILQAAIVDNSTVNTWLFVIPSTCLYEGISYSTYKILFVIQVIQGSLVLISENVYDSFFFSITMHLCGQFELLRMQFINVSQQLYGKKYRGNVLGPLIKRHCQLIALANNIEDIFSIIILVRLLIISIVIAASGFQLILALKFHDAVMITKTVTVLTTVLVQLFVYSVVGGYLKSQMKKAAMSIYSCNWHCLPKKFMRTIIFVIMRSYQPVQMLAGKFFSVNIETFMSILKSFLSYLSVLRVMIDA